MTNGPSGPQYPDFELIQGEAFYVQRSIAPAVPIASALASMPIAHPSPTCPCGACEVRRLQAQVETLTKERDAARAEHQRWLQEAWQRGVNQSATMKQQTYG